MNRTIRGMAGLLVALGASACANDYSLDFEGPPTKIQASPTVMFITANAAPKELLLRLTNDINQSVPTSFTVSNVPAGLTVAHDDDYRPDYVNPDGTLQQPDQLGQQRYFVSSNVTTGGLYTFTVASGSISQEITVRVLPVDLGAALSATAPAIGDPVTITAPATLSFSTDSKVSIPGGGDAVITDQSAKSITFIPIPGSSGPATVTKVTMDYAPTLSPISLPTAQSIDVPAVTSIPLVYSKTTLGAAELVTVTAAGFRFENDVVFSFGTKDAFTQMVSTDGTTATILVPTGLAGATASVSNVHLASLPAVSLQDIPSSTAITSGTGPYATIPGTGGATPPIYAIAGDNVGLALADMPEFTDASWDGASHPSSWYQVDVTGSGDRTFTTGWNNGSDIDLYVTNYAVSAYVCNSAGSSNPETCSGTVDNESIWIIVELWSGAIPGEVLTTVSLVH